MKKDTDKGVQAYFIVLAILTLGAVIWGIFMIKPLPLVYWSTSKDECVKVQIYNPQTENWDACDCEDIPEKYERIWVK